MSNYTPKDDGSVMGAIMTRSYKVIVPKKKEQRNFCSSDSRATDKMTFICPKCNRGWEFLIKPSKGTGTQKILQSLEKNVKYVLIVLRRVHNRIINKSSVFGRLDPLF